MKAPILMPFTCPVCTQPNAVELIALSRAGGMACVSCRKHLSSTDVMRAMHSPRERSQVANRVAVRAAPKPAMVWPPTAASRAAIAPLRERRDGMMN